jgi:hypothetical protein
MPESQYKKNSSRDLHIWIDDYDDLFSDFDPRPYTERTISDDFILELNKLTKEHQDFIHTLQFQIPEKLRDIKQEEIIIQRLHTDFKREYSTFSDDLKLNLTKGIIMTASGISLLLIAVMLTTVGTQKNWHNYMLVVFQPAGWFLCWSGMDKMIFGGRQTKIKKEFYRRLSKCKIEFVSM